MSTVDLAAAALYLVPAVVWFIIARQSWEFRRSARPRSRAFRLAPTASALVAVHVLLHSLWRLVPGDLRAAPAGGVLLLHVAIETTLLATLVTTRHMLRLLPLPEEAPSRAWLALNYGSAVAIGLPFVLASMVPGVPPAARAFASGFLHAGLAVLGALLFWQFAHRIRPGAPGLEYAGEMRRADLLIVVGGLAAAGLAFLALAAVGRVDVGVELFAIVGSLAVAGPWVMRMLGVVVPQFVVAVTMLAVTAAVLLAHTAIVPRVAPGLRPLLHLTTVLVLGFLLSQGQPWLRAVVHRLVFRRSLHQQVALQEALGALSPDLGIVECCRRALADLVRLRQLAGAAIILRDGEEVVHGTFDVEPLRRVWPRGAAVDALPTRPFGTGELRELPLPLREALIEANVGLAASPIISPRGRRGHLFMNTGLLGGVFREDDWEVHQAFVAQLALLLDAADLLARAVAVERSLAHAEKLAAIGETAARLAHEIRNPVTAARSLAQQLSRESGGQFAAELRLILAELERIERQVSALLRFARREDLRLAPVDLGSLARTVLDALRSRLAAATIAVALDTDEGVVARIDAERVRQVLVNLVENAIDALGEVPPPRRMSVAVTGSNGTATLDVHDNGPGVPADLLPRLFEPFFSSKPQGTGLGLAIARRAVEAHGGSIAVRSDGDGTTFHVELPLAREA